MADFVDQRKNKNDHCGGDSDGYCDVPICDRHVGMPVEQSGGYNDPENREQ